MSRRFRKVEAAAGGDQWTGEWSVRVPREGSAELRTPLRLEFKPPRVAAPPPPQSHLSDAVQAYNGAPKAVARPRPDAGLWRCEVYENDEVGAPVTPRLWELRCLVGCLGAARAVRMGPVGQV